MYKDVSDALYNDNLNAMKGFLRLGLNLNDIIMKNYKSYPIRSSEMLELFLDEGISIALYYEDEKFIDYILKKGYSYDNLYKNIVDNVQKYLSDGVLYAISLLPMDYFKNFIRDYGDKIDHTMINQYFIEHNMISKLKYLESIGWDILELRIYPINTVEMAKYLKNVGLTYKDLYVSYEVDHNQWISESIIDYNLIWENRDKELYKFFIDEGVDPIPTVYDFLFRSGDVKMKDMIEFIIDYGNIKLNDLIQNKEKYYIVRKLCN